jgi:hypothetical protein
MELGDPSQALRTHYMRSTYHKAFTMVLLSTSRSGLPRSQLACCR